LKQKFRTKVTVKKGFSGSNNLVFIFEAKNQWSDMCKNYFRDYKIDDEILLKIEPWEDPKSLRLNDYFHVLLHIYLKSPHCSYGTFDELKSAVKLNMGCGFNRYGYLDNSNRLRIVKTESGIPDDCTYQWPILKSFADYTMKEAVGVTDRLIQEMLSVGIDVDDLKLQYEEDKRRYKEESSLNREKTKAWNIFSKYIRRRDCLDTTGTLGYGICFTCGKRVRFEDSDAGHFIPGRQNAVLFEENAVHLQCKECNQGKGGNYEVYRSRMIIVYGEDEVMRLESMKHKVVKMSPGDYSDISVTYRAKLREMESL
jgi:hypothetical protein